MMKRTHVDEYYTAYLDGSLPDALRAQVEAHLRICPQCAREIAEMSLLVGELRDLPELAPPKQFTANVRARLPQRAPERPKRWFLPCLTGGTAVAAALLIVFLRTGMTPVVPTTHAPESRVATQYDTRSNTPLPKLAMKSMPLATGGKTKVIAASPKAPAEAHGATQPLPAVNDERSPRNDVGRSADRIRAQAPHAETANAQEERVEIALAPPPADEPMLMMTRAARPSVTMSDTVTAGGAAPTIDAAVPLAAQAPAETATTQSDDAMGSKSVETPVAMAKAAPVMPPDGKSDRVDSAQAPVPATTLAAPTTLAYHAYTKSAGSLTAELHAAHGTRQLVLHVNGMPGATVELRYLAPVSAPGGQTSALPLHNSALAISLPDVPQGAVLQLTFKMGAALDSYQLILPIHAKTPIAQTEQQPVLPALRQLANATGNIILYPQSFLALPPMPSASHDAVRQFATQHGYQVAQRDGVLQIVDKP